MHIAPSTPYGLATAASLLLLALTAACSTERPARPHSVLTNTNINVMPNPSGSRRIATQIHEYGSADRIIGLAEEEESHAVTPASTPP